MCLGKQSYKANMSASITESGSEMFEVGHWAPLQEPIRYQIMETIWIEESCLYIQIYMRLEVDSGLQIWRTTEGS